MQLKNTILINILIYSIVSLGDPDDLVATGAKTSALEEWRDLAKLSVLNLSYDVTPASFVDAIISEISVIPTTSVPVVLRLKSMDPSVS